MDETTLRVFTDGVLGYFGQFKRGAEVAPAYLADSPRCELMQYTGIIGIAGEFRGCVYYTAPDEKLRFMLSELGEVDHSDHLIADLCGEIANTLSGNARRELGDQFVISVPVVVQGDPANLHVPSDLRSFVIPIVWRRMRSAVVVSIDRP
ncbi:MAG: chemotaxis protein CheX [Burkholderiaceae bacterium]|jgi:chemotaxis protein CheX